MVVAPFFIVVRAMFVLTQQARVRKAYMSSYVLHISSEVGSVVTCMRTSHVIEERR
jgi:hypothetical protein